VNKVLDIKKVIATLLCAAVCATAGAYIDVQLLKSRFEMIIDDVKVMKSDVQVIKEHLIKTKVDTNK
jgi:hypothetical protein